MARIIRKAAARQDLVGIVAHYIREGSPATARRFREGGQKGTGRTKGDGGN
jgi:plasmid stabilization system protein ParE